MIRNQIFSKTPLNSL